MVFGGGRGIGAAVGSAFATAGDTVTLVARTEAQVRETARQIGATALVADVGDPQAVARVFERVPMPDVVVHAAGVQGGPGAVGPLWETDPLAFAAVVRINFLGTYHVLRESLRRMQSGAVICFSGGGAAFPRPYFAAYGATKTGVLRLVETAQRELREQGREVSVFALAPGAVRTAMTEEVLALGVAAGSAEAEAARKITQGEGVPPQLAGELCRFLATPQARPLAGRLVHVKESYREYVRRGLSEASGCLRRIDYPEG